MAAIELPVASRVIDTLVSGEPSSVSQWVTRVSPGSGQRLTSSVGSGRDRPTAAAVIDRSSECRVMVTVGNPRPTPASARLASRRGSVLPMNERA